MSWYISYYYDDSPYAAYAQQKMDFKNNYSTSALAQKAKKMWSQFSTGASQEQVNKLLDFYFELNSKGESKIQQYVQQALDTTANFQVPSYNALETDSYPDFNSLKELFQKVREFTDSRIEQDSNVIPDILKYDAMESIVSNAISNSGLNKTPLTLTKGHVSEAYKNVLYQTINSIEDGIMSLTAYKNLSAIQKTAVSQLSKTYSLLGIIGNLIGDTQFLHDNQGSVDHFFRAYLNKVGKDLGKNMGKIEELIVKVLVEQGADKIIEGLKTAAVGSNMVKIKPSGAHRAAEKGRFINSSLGAMHNSTLSTQDVALSVNLNSNGDGAKADVSVNVPLPGISVKTTRLKEAGDVPNIKIKSKTMLEVLLHDMPYGQIGYILNFLYACARNREDGGGLVMWGAKGRKPQRFNTGDMADASKMAIIANGLIGQMTPEDFSYLFIVNRQVFTVPQVLNSILTSSGAIDKDIVTLKFNGLNQGRDYFRWLPEEKTGQYSIANKKSGLRRSGLAQGYLLSKVLVDISLKLNINNIKGLGNF